MGITAKFVIVASAFFTAGAALVEDTAAPFGNHYSYASAGITTDI